MRTEGKNVFRRSSRFFAPGRRGLLRLAALGQWQRVPGFSCHSAIQWLARVAMTDDCNGDAFCSQGLRFASCLPEHFRYDEIESRPSSNHFPTEMCAARGASKSKGEEEQE